MAEGFEVLTISCKDAKKFKDDKKVTFLDVRTLEERKTGKIEGDHHIYYKDLEMHYKELKITNKIMVYSNHHFRSIIATIFLRSRGYKAYAIEGGLEKWKTLS